MGDAGKDQLWGNSGTDKISGGADDDYINGLQMMMYSMEMTETTPLKGTTSITTEMTFSMVVTEMIS